MIASRCHRFATSLFVMALMYAGSGQAHASELAEAVVRSSALGEVIDQYPSMLTEGISQGLSRSGEMDPMLKGAITGMVGQAFNSRKIRGQIVADLDAGLSESALNTVKNWYLTPLGKNVSALEIAATKPAAWREIESRGPELIRQYRGSDREKLFSQFDRASRATESAVDTAIAVQVAFGTAMAAFNGSDADFDSIRNQVESQRTMIRGMVEQQVYAAYLHTYQSLSDDQLKDYIAFMKTPAGDRFNEVVTNSVQQAIIRPVENIGSGLMRLFSPKG
ncbi:DUF2059 domain-containing protein [Marinobacter caseinilyticus]|uniref:DUF2059 domain-containing protein n=1 Tax=Marinobacter caseinilyticus TaxID=2692195 RepID=UPI001F3811A1|nr:DUF2059 domain-containing protein [Marinobacter caseinilyticus]